MDKETKLILSWVGIDPDTFDIEKVYRSPKLWIGLIIVCFLLGTIIALSSS